MTETSTDRIEREVIIRAPRSKVWRAISNAKEFGTWFGAEWKGEFAPGATVRGRITHPGYDHLKFDIYIERMEPEHLFSYRWHPYDVNPDQDLSHEPTTLVVFELEDAPEGTRLRMTESGFEGIPAERRDEAFRMNSQGWTQQMENVSRYAAEAK